MSNARYTQHYDEWERLYTEENWSSPMIARHYGCSKSAVEVLLRKRGIKLTGCRGPVMRRFWKYVDKGDPEDPAACWEWTGAKAKGYGRFWDGEGYDGAHRFSYRVHVGEIPDGLFVCHHCDNPACVRPEHLFVGDAVDNGQDMAEKGRSVDNAGEKSPVAKLTRAEVLEIRERYEQEEDATHRSLAAEYGVTYSAVGSIVRGESWTHL